MNAKSLFTLRALITSLTVTLAIGSVACATEVDDEEEEAVDVDGEFAVESENDDEAESRGQSLMSAQGTTVDGEVGTSESAVSKGMKCDAICGGVGVLACAPIGGVVGSLACGFAGVGVCIAACADRNPVRISEEKARRCLVRTLGSGSSARRIGYKGTRILYRVRKNGRVGYASVGKTYAGPSAITISWRFGDSVRPVSPANCPLDGR